MPGAHHVNRRSMFQFDFLPFVTIGVYFGGEFALRVDHKRQAYFVFISKLLGVAAQVLRIDLKLVGKNVVTELIAQIFEVESK